jgi:hypothetical protein
MLSTEWEYLCTVVKFFIERWNAFDRVGIPLYRVGMILSGLEYFLEIRNSFDSVEIHVYRVGVLNTGLECFIQG